MIEQQQVGRRLLISDLKAWLQETYEIVHEDSNVEDPVAFEAGLTMSDEPDLLVSLVFVSGGRLVNDDAFETRPFRMYVRGPQFRPDIAERVAMELDDLIMMDLPGNLGIQSVVWNGGPPALILQDEAERMTYSCTYIPTASTNF